MINMEKIRQECCDECCHIGHENLTLSYALYNGHFDCIRNAHKNGCELTNRDAGYYVSMFNDINVLKYFTKNGCLLNSDTAARCARVGNLEGLKYIYENGTVWDQNYEFIYHIMTFAAENGHLDCVKYAFEHGCKITDETIRVASDGNHYDVVSYLRKNY